LIAEARFFQRDAWVAAPADWSMRTQTGAKYELSSGEGRRIWTQCLDIVRAASDVIATAEPAARYGEPILYARAWGKRFSV